MDNWQFAAGTLAATVGFIGVSLMLFRRIWRAGGALRPVLVRLTISVGTLLILFLGLEAFFGFRYVQSDGYGTTLAGQRWFHVHWNPINSLGYRDHEHDWKDDKSVFIVGDSIVAGHGVDNISERFSGVLERGLGEGWQVAVIAQCGWDPEQEYNGLVAHPHVPDRIIVSYYINDIENAARAHANPPPTHLQTQPPTAVRWLVEHSYFVNWFYWRVLRGAFGTIYWDWLKDAYEDPEVLATHAKDLDRFIAHAEKVGASIQFVVWPNLDYIEGSLPYTDRIVALLEERNVPVLDLGKHFSGRSPGSLVVNSMDGHPNPATHAEVAQLLLQDW